MQARYYDPVIGRFYSNDPVGFTGDVTSFNRYSYVGNNPYKYKDPDGRNRVLATGARLIKNPTRTPRIVSRAIRSAAEGAGILSPVLNDNAGDVGSGVNPDVPDSSDSSEEGSGSYTNTHASGKKYHGKGKRKRSQQSGRRTARKHKDPHVATDYTDAPNDREGFKDESKRLDGDGGVDSDSNYNEVESPGKKYREQDGDN